MGAIALVVISSIGAALVAGITLLAAGADGPGALLAARNTARFSSAVFLLALGSGASRGHRIDVALGAAMALAAGASVWLLLRRRASAAASPGVAP